MALEDDLKARTSALISQQMANWVVEIQRAIQGHQAALVSALDELGETVARYDEKVDEGSIGQAIGDVLAQQPPAAGVADYSGLKAAIAAIEKGTNLSEVLTQLMAEVTRHVERAAMFIVKNNAAVGWHARGFDHPEAVKTLTIPLTADTVFRLAHGSRSGARGHVNHSPATAQALGRLGGTPQGILAVPLILRDKVAAILYCDTTQDEMPTATADLVELMVSFAGKVIDVLSAAPKAPAVAGGTSPGMRAVAPPAPTADGLGRSLEVIALDQDNATARNWRVGIAVLAVGVGALGLSACVADPPPLIGTAVAGDGRYGDLRPRADCLHRRLVHEGHRAIARSGRTRRLPSDAHRSGRAVAPANARHRA